MKKSFKAMFLLTQSPGLSWYRCHSFVKRMKIDTAIWPDCGYEKLPNWQEVLERETDKKKIDIVTEWIVKEAVSSNVIVSQRVWTAQGLAVLYALKEHWNKKVLLEIDDDAFNVDSSNPAFVGLTDRKTKIFKTQLELADGVITTNENLKELYQQHNKKVFIVKNAINFNLWDRVPKPKTKGKKVKIGWQGAWHHGEDLSILEPVIPKILKKYKGKVEFHFFGYIPEYLKGCCKFHEMKPIDKYIRYIVSQNLDIILAPLQDTHFNRGISNIRVLEAGAMKKAVVASDNKNLIYAKTINGTDDGDGLLVKTTEDWIDNISYLIDNPDERRKMGSRLYYKVKRDYNAKDVAQEYEKILKNI